MVRAITAGELRTLREQGGLYALLDVRERGEFNLSHIPWSCPVPRGSLEQRLPALVPGRRVLVVFCCDDGPRSALAAATAERMGYQDVAVLAEGLRGWSNAGFLLAQGTMVAGKEYGERIATQEAIPHLTSSEVIALRERGEELVIADVRTRREYEAEHLPGADHVPGGQLSLAIFDLVGDRDPTIVVNCAGRTRGILGAYLLRRMGFRKAFALRNGTPGWRLEGYEFEHGPGRTRQVRPTPAGEAAAGAFAVRVAGEESLPLISPAELRRIVDSGTVHYLVDVRLREEYSAGHIPSAIWVPGGQLALESEQVLAVRQANIVVMCDTGIRSAWAAAICKGVGYPNVAVLEGGLRAWIEAGGEPESGEPREPIFGLGEARARLAATSPRAVWPAVERGDGVTVLDVRGSADFALGHLPGSLLLSRGRLELGIAALVPDTGRRIVTVCGTGTRSTLAAATLMELGYADVTVLDGGLRAWEAAGLPTEAGLEGAGISLEEAKGDGDIMQRRGPLTRTADDLRRYLDWEEKLGNKYQA